MSALSDVRGRTADDHGLRPLRFGLNEWLGALGDLGTFVPIYLGLVALCGLPPGRSLLLFGATYVGAALFFRLPMPVQPLKAMAAVAIAQRLDAPVLAAAGLWMGAILLALSLAGKVDALGRYFTRPIVKGIQLGVGLILIKNGIKLLFGPLPQYALGGGHAAGLPSWHDAWTALTLLVVPQLPLTLGNAVYAVSDVAKDYFGPQARRATPRNLTLSLGLSNLLAGAAGGLPVCHGSGGMSAHYGFGARSGGATLLMGLACMGLALGLPHRAQHLFAQLPPALLGAMLIYPGVCHVLLVRKLDERVPLAVLMGLLGAFTGNLAYALAFGLAGQALLARFSRERAA